MAPGRRHAGQTDGANLAAHWVDIGFGTDGTTAVDEWFVNSNGIPGAPAPAGLALGAIGRGTLLVARVRRCTLS